MKNFLIIISVFFCISAFSAEQSQSGISRNLFGAKKANTLEGQERLEKLQNENAERTRIKEQKITNIQVIERHSGLTQPHGTIIAVQIISNFYPDNIVLPSNTEEEEDDDEEMEDAFSDHE